jgi:hypothetical protein
LRLRAALERLTVDLPAEGRAYKGNEALPDAGTFYKAYNAGITAQFAHSSGIARAALATAQSEEQCLCDDDSPNHCAKCTRGPRPGGEVMPKPE